ncbi:MAG: DUF58 domain-containing protein [Nanoarchaeota archaeon]|nr:DUF58 domain-containing protein [Nanoarchaeota archaeon]MBU1320742.1 DUF58 domain-containing protein [Nanoarchaeota archaeon]MBU1596895.1 DUF58 domain-containing protein [Nanoarchaeota archaeon]MBU2440829.1 DUF58 domain-containing protein [Nanoarchaeota archaeon]
MPIKELKIDLTPHIQRVKLKPRRDILNRVLEGNWSTIFKGQGLEFAGFRAYTYGDDASKIDWGASLRAHDILVRELEEYHNFNVFFLVDVSNSMLFSSTDTGKLKAEYAAELAFSLCYAMMQSGDAIGLGMFNDKLVTKIPPNLGKGAYYQILRALSNKNNYGGDFDLTKALLYVRSFLKERSVIILISDFIGLQEGWHSYLNILSGIYDIIGIMVRDPRDSFMPQSSGQYLIEDPFSNEKLYIDSHQYAKVYRKETKKEEEFIRSSFEKAKLGFIQLRTDEDFQEPIMKYFRKRLTLTR